MYFHDSRSHKFCFLRHSCIPGPHTHSTPRSNAAVGTAHSRNSSQDLRVSSNGCAGSSNGVAPLGSRSSNDIRNMATRAAASCALNGHSRAASLDLRHSRNSSADLNKLLRNDVALVFGNHHQGIRISFTPSFCCYIKSM